MNRLTKILIALVCSFGIAPLHAAPSVATAKVPAKKTVANTPNQIVTKLEKAPAFKLQDQNGKWHELAKLKGKYVVLEWTSSKCPFVVDHYERGTMVDLEKKLKGPDIVWLAVNSTHYNKPSDSKAWASKWKIPYPTLQDPSGLVGKAYKAQTTPHMFVIDPTGNIVYRGAIDDDSSNEKKIKLNYVEAAINQLRKKTPVSVGSTKPYGCSVKYKS